MRLEIEISEEVAETFNELAEASEVTLAESVSKAVEGLGNLASGDLPGYAFAEFLVDPPEFDEEEEVEMEAEAGAGAF